HLKEQLLSTPPDFTCALRLLKEIKENCLRNEIEEALDTDLLKQEAEHGALDVPRLSNYILNLMALLCAPVRDEAVQKLETITDPVRLLRGTFCVLGLMKMDMVNYTLKSFRPYLQEHSIRICLKAFVFKPWDFKMHIPFSVVGLLNYTTRWLTKAATDITTLCPSSPDSPGSSCSTACSLPNRAAYNSKPPSPTMVLYQGYLNLLCWDPENEEFPETLLMDRIRLQDVAFQLQQLTILDSVLLVVRSFSGEVLFSSPEFVDRLKCITKALTEEFISRPEEAMLSVSEQVSQEIHQGLKDVGLTTLSSENTAALLGQLQGIAKKENCIRSIVDQRIRLFLKFCLLHGMKESLLHFPRGLILIERESAELGWKFVSLMHHNQQVFSPYYAEILKKHHSRAQKTDMEPI
uniref:T-complex 11 family, X-linked 2 n=1 Tax=Aotus nancymaae TaxID=37293 RepID=A0A2K5DMZ3_AOTNA